MSSAKVHITRTTIAICVVLVCAFVLRTHHLYKYDDAVLGGKDVVRNNKKDSEISHSVVKGDTLYSLSKTYNTSVEKLKSLNNLIDNELSIGQILIIK